MLLKIVVVVNYMESCSCHFSVDAAKEEGSLGRLVNDEHENLNSKMKTIKVDEKPHLCLFALKDISPGEEITMEILIGHGDARYLQMELNFHNDSTFGSLLSFHTISQQSQASPHVVIFE